MGKPYVRHSSVLVLDYQMASLQAACESLSRRGFEVIAASSGGEAFDKLKGRSHIDLTFIDMDLSRSGGIAFADGLRQMECFRTTRILMMSSSTESPKSFCTIGQGERVLVLQKPIASEMLVDEAIAAIASVPR